MVETWARKEAGVDDFACVNPGDNFKLDTDKLRECGPVPKTNTVFTSGNSSFMKDT